MPFFYVWLLVVAAAVTCADYFLYHYKYWYAQGTSMGLIVLLTFAIFGCAPRREERKNAIENHGTDTGLNEYQPGTRDSYRKVMVTRSGVQRPIAVTELTVGDNVLLSVGDFVPADCVVLKCDD